MSFHRLFSIIVLLSIIYNCSNSNSYSDTIDNAFEELEIKYAKNFKIRKFSNGGYELLILNPNSKEIENQIKIETGKKKRIISLTATFNGMISILNESNSLVGISAIDYIYDPKIKSRYKSKKIIEYGDESSYSIEKIISSNANLIVYSGFGDTFPNESKLKQLGIDIIPIYDWREDHPLGKAEWLKVVGMILGKEKEAFKEFDEIEAAYLKTKKLITKKTLRPSVMSGNLIGDIWYMPGGDSYFSTLLKDAGANYVNKDVSGTVSLEFSIESVLKNNSSTEFWVNPGADTKIKIDKINPHAKRLRCYDNIFCYSPNMNKFWEQSASKPHLVLSDLIHIFHPEGNEIETFYFYKKINQ